MATKTSCGMCRYGTKFRPFIQCVQLIRLSLSNAASELENILPPIDVGPTALQSMLPIALPWPDLYFQSWHGSAMLSVVSPRGELGWTCPPHFCKRSLLKLIQIWRVFIGGRGIGGRSSWLRLQTPVIGSRSPCLSTLHILTWRRPCMLSWPMCLQQCRN